MPEPATWGLVLSLLRTIGTWFGRRKKEPSSTEQLVEVVDQLVERRVAGDIDAGIRIRDLENEVEGLKEQLDSAEQRLASGEGLEGIATPGERERAKRLAEDGQYVRAVDLLERGAEQSEALENLLAAGALAFLYDTPRAKGLFERAAALAPDDPRAWNLLGHVLDRLGELAEAEAAYERVLAIAEDREDTSWVAVATGNLGLIHHTRGDLTAAEVMHNKSLVINQELGDKGGIATQHGNLGVIHLTRGDLDAAEVMFEKALETHEAVGRREGMAEQYGNLGLVYLKRGDLDAAESMHKKALAINEELGRKEGMAIQHGNLGEIYQARGDLDATRRAYEAALELFEAVGAAPQVEQVQQLLGDLEDEEE